MRCKDYPEVSYFQGTMTDTNLPECSIDAIIDKGLLDSILCGQMGATDVTVYMIEVYMIYTNISYVICYIIQIYHELIYN